MKALSRALPASSQQDGSGAGRASPSSSAGLRSAKRSISAAAVTSVSASHTPRTTGSELDKLMKQSVEAILHCYERRAKDFTHVEGLAASQRHQISALESALSQLRRENAELKQEKTALHASQNLLLARYAALKKNVSQLESFRQGIATMVEGAPGINEAVTLADSPPDHRQQQQQQQHHNEMPELRKIPQFPDSGFDNMTLQQQHSIYDDHTLQSVDLQQSVSIPSPLSRGILSRSQRDGNTNGTHVCENMSRSVGGRLRNEIFDGAMTLDRASRSFNDNRNPDLRLFSNSVKHYPHHHSQHHLHQHGTPPVTISARPPASKKGSLSEMSDMPVPDITSPSSATTPAARHHCSVSSGSTPTPFSMQQRAPTNKPNPQQPQDTIAAPALYKEIRASLTPSEFEDFASNVAAFNAGDQTAEQTVKNIGGIVRNKRLYACMTSLIYTALDESVTSNSNGKPAVAVDDSVPAGRRSDAA